MTPLFTEAADVSVRPAVPGDEVPLAAIQLEAWRATHGELLGTEVLDSLDPAEFRSRWAQAISAPPGPGYRVLVALNGSAVVGFASVAPVLPSPQGTGPDHDTAPGGEVLALEVTPAERRTGHGSRLLAAVVDLLREDGATTVQLWVLDGDTARETFLSSAGLGAIGPARTLGREGDPRGVTERLWGAEI